ncbi:MAG: hypothetical protein H0X39_17260 [Actinobacteria bacterium]|nr:hypothetical protein [Actinomycetota bacterium]
MLAIDEVLPRFDAREVHTVQLELPPEQAIALALGTPVVSDPLVRVLFRIRGLRDRGTIGDAMTRLGFGELIRRDGQVVLGGSGTPWRPGVPIRPFAEAGPGSVQVVLDFRSDGHSLTTETRIAAIDAEARRRFLRYWRFVGPFSAVIRRRWLRRIAARAA